MREDITRTTTDANKWTGEVRRKTVEEVPSEMWPGDWVRFEAETAKWLRLNRKKWSMTDVSILFTMIEHVENRNLVNISATQIAELLGTTVQVVSRSMRRLIKSNWIERLGPSLYRLDVDLCWRGKNEARWEQAKVEGRSPGELFDLNEEERKKMIRDADRGECFGGD